MNEFKNYVPIENYSFKYNKYAYIDLSNNYKADIIFVKNKLKSIKFLGDYKNPNSSYSVIMCKVNKKDDELFRKCMDELKNNMLLIGNNDYQEFCETLINMLEEECKE